MAAGGFKHVSLELGGKSPNIVFDDAIGGGRQRRGLRDLRGYRADLHRRLAAAGAGEHPRSVHRATGRLGQDRTNGRSDGARNPGRSDHHAAAVSRRSCDYIDIARAEGARLVLGGQPRGDRSAARAGSSNPPFSPDVRNDMRIAQEEVFGPVLSVIPFRTKRTPFAIGNDVQLRPRRRRVDAEHAPRAHHGQRQLQAGTVWVNTYRAVSFMSPFGGYKHSGVGRERGHR